MLGCDSEDHILCSYLANLQRKIKIKKVYHCKTIPTLHTICTMASLLLCSHCPRRIRLAGHSARMCVFISQISSYLLIWCLGKWNFFSDANRIAMSDWKKSLNYTQSIHASFGKVKKLRELMKSFQKQGVLQQRTHKVSLKLPQPPAKKWKYQTAPVFIPVTLAYILWLAMIKMEGPWCLKINLQHFEFFNKRNFFHMKFTDLH